MTEAGYCDDTETEGQQEGSDSQQEGSDSQQEGSDSQEEGGYSQQEGGNSDFDDTEMFDSFIELPALDPKNAELHKIFREENLTESSQQRIIEWHNRTYPSATPILSTFRVKSAMKRAAPFQPFAVDICSNACYAFQRDDEDECPVCFQERFNTDGCPKRTIEMLPIGPQIAALYKNPSFIKLLDDQEFSIRSNFKGDTMQKLLENSNLFTSKYDIGLSLYTDGFMSHKKRGTKLNLITLQILNLPPTHRFKMEFLIDFAIIPNVKRLDSYLQYLIRELEELAASGLEVQIDSSTFISPKVHLLGSFGDIPSVTEVNFLRSHGSLLGCRFCTIIAINTDGVNSFQLPANNSEQPLRLLTIEEYKTGAPAVGIDRSSLFTNLPSFIDPTFVGLDEFHLFGQNLGPRIKNMFISPHSILRLMPRHITKISDCLVELARTSPLIFDGVFMDVFSKGGVARGVDWLVFLKFFVGSVLPDYVDLCHSRLPPDVSDATKDALRTISLICSVSLQREISESEIHALEQLIDKWQQFLKDHVSPRFFPISEHYLSHVPMVIRKMGPMSQYSCRVLERRIQMVKSKIHGTSRVAKQAENIMLNIAYDSQARRGAVDFQDVPADPDASYPYQVNMRDLDSTLPLSAMLCNYYGTPAIIDQNINCAKSLALGVNIAMDAALLPLPRKQKLSTYALVNCARRSSLPLLVKVLLMFRHNFSGAVHSLALCQVYQNVTVNSTSGIPECPRDSSNSDTINDTWKLEIIALDDILSSVAILKSDISRKLFFVWPEMKRIGLEVYNDDSIFDFP